MNLFTPDNEPNIKTGFTTPDNYFDDLPHQVMQQLKEIPVVPIYRKKSFIYAAAALLVLALMVPFLNTAPVSNELDETTLENYLTHQSGINQYELLTLLETEDIENIEIDMLIEDEIIEDQLSNNANLEQLLIE